MFGSVGTSWRLSEKIGRGYFWIYCKKDLFNINIHDFYFLEDSFMEFDLPEYLSISYYQSISGEELSPYRRLSAGSVKSFIGGNKTYRVLIHKNIPIRSVGIEITPAYYEHYLKQQYPDENINAYEAFRAIDQTNDFPEMVFLLSQVMNYRGSSFASKLFYEGKVAEAVSMVIERMKKSEPKQEYRIEESDIQRLETVTAYINDHFASEIPLARLTRIACMGTTKFKSTFKQFHGCTVTEYIQQRRIGQAEHLLSATDFPIGQIARTVGYNSSSRFSELFRRSTGLLPREYRKIINNGNSG